MSQPNQLVSKAIEIQQNALENSQRAMERAMEIPVQGTVDFQRNAAQLMLDGLEMGNWVNDQSVELTRNALDTYLTTVENAASDATQLTEQGMERVGDAGQQGLASTQQFAAAAAGNGSRSGTSEPHLPGPPQQSASPVQRSSGPPQQPAGTDGQPQTPPQQAPTLQQAPTPRQQMSAPQPETSAPQQRPSTPQQQPSTPQQQPTAGRHQQPAAPNRQPPAETRQQPPGAPQQQPPATPHQQPPAASHHQPPATAQQPPAGGQPTGQQSQGQPAQSLPQFQSGVTTRPAGPLQTRPPQEASAEVGPETGTETMPDGQRPPNGREVETDSDAAETPAETT